MKHFYLIGYMGAGKSSVAREMSSMLNLQVFEMDDILETRFGKSVAEIFSEDGAEAFRNAETELLKEITFDPTVGSRMTGEYQEAMGIEKANPFIVSCGGGVPLRDENIAIMRDNGVVIWLSAEAETIAERLSGSSGRPLLPADQSVDSIREMLNIRNPYYQKASDFMVVTDDKTIHEVALTVVKELLERLKENEGGEADGTGWADGTGRTYPETKSVDLTESTDDENAFTESAYSFEDETFQPATENGSEGLEDYSDDYEEMLESESDSDSESNPSESN